MTYGLYKSFDFNGDTAGLLELFRDKPGLFLLDSSLRESERGRYSFLGFEPFSVIRGNGKTALNELKKAFLPYQEAMRGTPTPLFSGIVGYLGYDLGLHLEKIKMFPKVDDLGLPQSFFGFYDLVIAVDHFAGKLHILSTGLPEKRPAWRQKLAAARLQDAYQRLKDYAPTSFSIQAGGKNLPDLSCDFTPETYFHAVHKALDHIRRGDVYQVNLAQRFRLKRNAHVALDPIDVYRSLRGLSPSSFGAYFDAGDFQVLSSSPEQFLQLKGNQLKTRPMKGTRPRGQNPREDKNFRRQLELSAKDKAELLMITDLERNDLGRICDFGSVRVSEMRSIEEYSTVFQATAGVEGRLRKDKDAFDALRACFPGGSVTGCPKLRAMEIIEELEPSRRGLYTGALGYIDFSGNMDFNILIRTMLVKGRSVSFHAGSGIVADSKPEQEYDEIMVKAKALRACLSPFSKRSATAPAFSRSAILPRNTQ